MCTIAAHDLLGARLLPTGSLGPGTPLYSNPGALGYEEEALAQVRECGGATMVRGSLLEKADCSAIPGDCCSMKGRTASGGRSSTNVWWIAYRICRRTVVVCRPDWPRDAGNYAAEGQPLHQFQMKLSLSCVSVSCFSLLYINSSCLRGVR